ncbi:MAG: hypothetical protein HQK54_17230, partial [Oligoflexales bacterium]|nr:hypothetical protein [Oligoflexales bacterium]
MVKKAVNNKKIKFSNEVSFVIFSLKEKVNLRAFAVLSASFAIGLLFLSCSNDGNQGSSGGSETPSIFNSGPENLMDDNFSGDKAQPPAISESNADAGHSEESFNNEEILYSDIPYNFPFLKRFLLIHGREELLDESRSTNVESKNLSSYDTA